MKKMDTIEEKTRKGHKNESFESGVEFLLHEIIISQEDSAYHVLPKDRMKIAHCMQGTGKIRQNNKMYEYVQDTCFILPAGIDCRISGDDRTGARWEYILVDQDKILRMLYPYNQSYIKKYAGNSWDCILFSYADSGDFSHIQVIMELLFQELREKKLLYMDNTSGLLQILLVYLFRNKNAVSDLGTEAVGYHHGFDAIYPAISYIQEHYQENIDVRDLAHLCNMSVSYMRKKFTNYIHMGPQEFLVRIRIKKACEMMITSQQSIEDIAYMVGFQSKSSFYRNFNQYVGCSPLKWKGKKLKQG